MRCGLKRGRLMAVPRRGRASSVMLEIDCREIRAFARNIERIVKFVKRSLGGGRYRDFAGR
jgi:hypothetical protein